MILAQGEIFDSKEQNSILEIMEQQIQNTMLHQSMQTMTVVGALDRLSGEIAAGNFDTLFATLPMDDFGDYKEQIVKLLSKENILFKLKNELGEDCDEDFRTQPPHGLTSVGVRRMPLGVLLHITAGNADGLPALSLAEGLLTGNINILKLPQADNNVSLKMIQRLIEIEPLLTDYIYVFDTPSSDVSAMKKMAELSNGIVVWGSELAVAAVRQMAPNGAKLIEWGPRLSFVYVSGYEKGYNWQEQWTALAEHIAKTKQLLCSSCQVIYLDTEDVSKLRDFGAEFLPYLESAIKKYRSASIGTVAQISLLKYADELEQIMTGQKSQNTGEQRGEGCSITISENSELELSYMFGNCLVKPLPRHKIMETMRKHKDMLQTVGLICPTEQRAELIDLLAKCGLNRIMTAGNMSAYFSGEAHDGEYAMRRYIRIVNVE